ncbi:MAG: YebC/PmpR family DNA-binding transcriptional regulator [Candidatus Dependentiae bacterium]
MAGHSKWKTIKHKKAALDAKRGKSFTRLIKEITVVARDGGGDPDGNPRLRTLMDKAKQINMPNENVIRAIKKGTGELPGLSYESVMYEGYGPGGIAILVDTLTDNKNRTVSDMRHQFSKKGGNLGESGSVGWMFEKKGALTFKAPNKTEDDLLELLLDYDISDIKTDDDLFTVYCDIKALEPIKKALQDTGIIVEHAELDYVAKNNISLDDAESEKALALLEILDDHDDVQNVYTNLA